MSYGYRFWLIHELDLFSKSNLSKPYGEGEYIGVYQCQKCGYTKLHVLEDSDHIGCRSRKGCGGVMSLHVSRTEDAKKIASVEWQLDMLKAANCFVNP